MFYLRVVEFMQVNTSRHGGAGVLQMLLPTCPSRQQTASTVSAAEVGSRAAAYMFGLQR
jgi:hypothetical protein